MSDQLICKCGCEDWHIWRGDIECKKCTFRVDNLIPNGEKMRKGLQKAILYLPNDVGGITLFESA